MMSIAVLGLDTFGFGVMNPPRLCLPDRAGVPPPIDTRDGLGVVVLALRPFVPARAWSSCFAVIPTYLLARDPTVILASATTALLLVLFPSMDRTGRVSSRELSSCWSSGPSLPLTELEIVRVERLGVDAAGLVIWESNDGVGARLCREYEAWEEARDRWEEATEAGRDGPDVGGESLSARTNTPHCGRQVKY